MNCESVHRRLLELEHLGQPPAELRKHLAVCAVCSARLAQLEQIERDVPLLPVPAPSRKAAFLDHFAHEMATPRPSVLHVGLFGSGPSQRERGLQKMAVSVALAAALLMVAFGVWLWKHDDGANTEGPGRPLVLSPLNRRLAADPSWKEAQTPHARVKILDELANEVEGKALALGTGKALEDLEAQVQLYREVINRLTDEEAPIMTRGLSVGERHALLDPTAHRLAEVFVKANLLKEDNPDAKKPLEELAQVAKAGGLKLRALMG